jgi:hypothetical protein
VLHSNSAPTFKKNLLPLTEKPSFKWLCFKNGVSGWSVWWRGEVCVYRVLVGKPEGKRPMGRPKSRWEDNIRMDLQEVGCGFVDWIGLDQDRERWRALVSAVMNLRYP